MRYKLPANSPAHSVAVPVRRATYACVVALLAARALDRKVRPHAEGLRKRCIAIGVERTGAGVVW